MGDVGFCGIDGHRLQEQGDDPLTGKTIDRYRLLNRIGVGGMGCVYRVVHTVLEHQYAIKILFGDFAMESRIVQRFRREARAVSQIKHPNVVAVFDFGGTAQGLTFMVMELVRGESLSALLRREGPLRPSRAAAIARQIAQGLSAAHEMGFVHRDIKPSNIMITQAAGLELVKLLDFGVVGLVEDSRSAQRTGTGLLIGTPIYMAPEQAREARQAGPAADLYSLGVVLYEMLSGKPPFDDEVFIDVLIKHTLETPPPLPPAGGLEMLVAWLLEKEPGSRPESADAVIQELDRLNLKDVPAQPQVSPFAVTFELSPEEAVAAGLVPSSVLAQSKERTDEDEDPTIEGAPLDDEEPEIPMEAPITFVGSPTRPHDTASLQGPPMRSISATSSELGLEEEDDRTEISGAMDYLSLRDRLDMLYERAIRHWEMLPEAQEEALKSRFSEVSADVRPGLSQEAYAVLGLEIDGLEEEIFTSGRRRAIS